jgi:hypothetical protein
LLPSVCSGEHLWCCKVKQLDKFIVSASRLFCFFFIWNNWSVRRRFGFTIVGVFEHKTSRCVWVEHFLRLSVDSLLRFNYWEISAESSSLLNNFVFFLNSFLAPSSSGDAPFKLIGRRQESRSGRMKWIGRLQCQQLLCLIGKLELLPRLCLYFGTVCVRGTCLSKWDGSRGSRRNIKKTERGFRREKMEGVSSVICVGPENTSGTWHSRIFFPIN